jgi:hypothetical protein
MTAVPANGDRAAKAEVAYNEALRMIQAQQTRLSDSRATAGTLLTAASIVAAFMGAQALANGRSFHAATWIATIAFTVVASSTAWLLFPRRGWKFTNDPRKLVDGYVDNPTLDVESMRVELAKYTDDNYSDNEKRMTWRYLVLSIACLALITEVIAFLIDLTNRGVARNVGH